MEATPKELHQLLTEIFIILDDSERRTLRRHNLSIRQFHTLYHLDLNRGLSINDLSDRLLCNKSNTTRLIEQMKQDGLVTREPSEHDRRYVSVRLTETGERLRKEAVATHQSNINEWFDILSTEEQLILKRLLFKFRDSLHDKLAEMPS